MKNGNIHFGAYQGLRETMALHLDAIHWLLVKPTMKLELDEELAELYFRDPSQYNTQARDYTKRYAMANSIPDICFR